MLRNFAIAVVLTTCLAGCGFRPLYAPPAENVSEVNLYAFDAFRQMEIKTIKDRDGQFLRTRLLRLLQPKGRDRTVRYELTVELRESEKSLAVKKSAVATRANLKITARFNVHDFQQDNVVFSSQADVVSGFNIFSSEFQTLAARDGARKRALDELAQEIRVRLATFITREPESEPAS